MTLALAFAELPKLISRLAGIAAFWRDRRNPIAGATLGAVAFLSLVSIEGVGQDEIRTEYDEDRDGQEFLDTIVGRREAVLRVAVEVYQAGLAAWTYLEEVRTGLATQHAADVATSINWTLYPDGQLTDPGGPVAEEIVSFAVLEIPCAFTISKTEREGYTYIAKMSGTATLTEGATESEEPFEYEVI